jgi:hypothetical protein
MPEVFIAVDTQIIPIITGRSSEEVFSIHLFLNMPNKNRTAITSEL